MGVQSDAIAAALTSRVEQAVRMLVLEIDANLRASPDAGGTPVDTGHARSNWVASVGGPWLEEIAGVAGETADANLAAMLAYRLIQGPAYLSNNVPYINVLDVLIAPGFVEVAIARALATTEQHMSMDLGSGQYASSIGGGAADNLASAYSPFGGS